MILQSVLVVNLDIDKYNHKMYNVFKFNKYQKGKIMENPNDKSDQSNNNKSKVPKVIAAVALIASIAAGLNDLNEARDGDDSKPAPSTTIVDIEPDNGESGGVVVIPEDPNKNKPAT